MTCQDMHTILAKGFRNTTRAERIAMVRHITDCATCADYIHMRADRARKKITPERLAELTVEAQAVSLKDYLNRDPEAR